MTSHRYTLERGSKKYLCPNCNKKTFVRYIDTDTNQHLPDKFGRCDRESNCSYHLNPYKEGYGKESYQNSNTYQPMRKAHRKPFVPLPYEVLESTLNGYENNLFIQNLTKRISFPFSPDEVAEVISLYYLGTITSNYMKGATCFPFIDNKERIRAIQVKQFDTSNHTTKTNFLHSILTNKYKYQKQIVPDWLDRYNKQDLKVSCLFGEHLLPKYPNHTVGLVEAPKTAIYSTLYFGLPHQSVSNIIWLAVFNLSSLNVKKCKALKGRKVVLFPDLSSKGTAFEKWSKKADEIQSKLKNSTFLVSDLLEKEATQEQKEKGLDLADFLISHDWRNFRSPQTTPIQPPPIQSVLSIKEYEEKELLTFFDEVQIPKKEYRLDNCTLITDIEKFLEIQLHLIKYCKCQKIKNGSIYRLSQLRNVVTSQIN